jgi:hypothetical protein
MKLSLALILFSIAIAAAYGPKKVDYFATYNSTGSSITIKGVK